MTSDMEENPNFIQQEPTLTVWLKNHWPIAVLGFAIIIFLVSLGLAYTSSNRQVFSKTSNEAVYLNQSSSMQSNKVLVDVGGAVSKPGTYWLASSDRLEQAIAAAGGFDSLTVDRDFVARELNLASKVTDGQKIYVLHNGEDRSHVPANVLGLATIAKINVNTASSQEFQTVSGITSAIAAKIIAKRPYKTLDELVAKKALTKTQLQKFQDSLWVN